MTAIAMTAPMQGGAPVRRVTSIRPVPTRSGRIRRSVVVLALLAIVALWAPQAFAESEAPVGVAYETHTVAPGESLWSIAAALTGPGEDVQETIAELRTMNAMEGSGLQAGEQLRIPALER